MFGAFLPHPPSSIFLSHIFLSKSEAYATQLGNLPSAGPIKSLDGLQFFAYAPNGGYLSP